MAPRTILHVDMDAFFASVEQRDDPTLRGKPVLVGGAGRRGVVAAASYEAREFGCRSAQPMSQALRRCPHAVVVPPRGRAYQEASRAVFRLFGEVTPAIEPLSIDEAFLDVTGSRRLLGDGKAIAAHVRREIRERVDLTASVGIAENKFLAKLASDWNKPDGWFAIPQDDAPRILAPLSVRRIFGVGPAAEKRLARFGLRTIGDLQAAGLDTLRARLGEHGIRLYELAHGRDDRPVVSDGEARSIGQECTFGENVVDPSIARAALDRHVDAVARRLRDHGLFARTMTIKVRFGDFETITRSKTLSAPSQQTDTLLAAARGLYDRWVRDAFQPVRLIGATSSNFEHSAEAPGLFSDPVAEGGKRLDSALDAIRDRFGEASIERGNAGLGRTERQDGLEHGDDRVEQP